MYLRLAGVFVALSQYNVWLSHQTWWLNLVMLVVSVGVFYILWTVLTWTDRSSGIK